MEIEIFTLCDYATDNGGKLTIVGTFDNVTTPTLPVQQMIGIAIRLRFSEKQTGNHNIELKITDPSKAAVGNMNGTINVPAPVEPLTYTSVNMALNLGLEIKTKGVYKIEFHLNGEFQSGLSFLVR
ncbi:MAG: hypothetical protein JWO58_2436 [Chitinophagaceae bacterium]|nr:hypothetical protein [Chitinophagaceae bacterium]